MPKASSAFVSNSRCVLILHTPCPGALPIPGLPHGTTSPFTYPVLGSAVLHLAAQAVVFGAATVLVDVGVMQLLRRLWRRFVPGKSSDTGGGSSSSQHQPHHEPRSHSSSSGSGGGDGGSGGGGGLSSVSPGRHPPLQPAPEAPLSDTGTRASTHAALSGVSGQGHIDSDVAAERRAVKAGQGLNQAMVRGSRQRAVVRQWCSGATAKGAAYIG